MFFSPKFRQGKVIKEAYGLGTNEPLVHEPRLYSRKLVEQGPEQEEAEEEEKEWVDVVEMEEMMGLVEEDRLVGRDLRLLVRAEEELGQVTTTGPIPANTTLLSAKGSRGCYLGHKASYF